MAPKGEAWALGAGGGRGRPSRRSLHGGGRRRGWWRCTGTVRTAQSSLGCHNCHIMNHPKWEKGGGPHDTQSGCHGSPRGHSRRCPGQQAGHCRRKPPVTPRGWGTSPSWPLSARGAGMCGEAATNVLAPVTVGGFSSGATPVTEPWAPLGPATETELWLHPQTGRRPSRQAAGVGGRTQALCALPPGGPVPRGGSTQRPWGGAGAAGPWRPPCGVSHRTTDRHPGPRRLIRGLSVAQVPSEPRPAEPSAAT